MLNDLMFQSRLIYDRLQDDLSRYIYRNRWMYNLTGDNNFLKKMVETAPYGKIFMEELNKAKESKKKICIFGAGHWGKNIKNFYNDIDFFCFIDNKIATVAVEGLPVFSFAEWLDNYKDSIVVIAIKFFYKEIYEQLLKNGVKKENIINAGLYIERAGIAHILIYRN